MSSVKKYQYIQKGLTTKTNSTLKLAITTSFSVIILFLFLFIINGNELTTINQLHQTYGKYTASIPKEKEKDYTELYNDPLVKDYYEFYEKNVVEDNIEYQIYSSDREILDFINIELVEGNYPQSDNEIALERKYLYFLGIKDNEMLGAKVKLNAQEYVVSGIIVEHGVESGDFENNKYTCLLNSHQFSANTIFLQISDTRQYEEVLDILTEKYQINKEECFANFELFTALGYTFGEDTFASNQYLYYGMFVVILLVVLHTLGNYMKLWLNNTISNIGRMNLLGISYKLIRRSLLLYFGKMIIRYIVIGIGIGVILGFILLKSVFIELNVKDVIETFPYAVFLISMLIYISIVLIRTTVITKVVEHIDPIKVQFLGKGQISAKGTRFKGHILPIKTKHYRWKLYRHNILDHKFGQMVAIIGVAISITIFCIGNFFLTANSQVFGHDTDMNYKVAMKPDYLLEEGEYEQEKILYKELINMKEECMIAPVYLEFADVEFERDSLSLKFLQFLEKDQIDNLLQNYMNNSTIPLRVAILGYTEEQLQQLYTLNKKEYKDLGDNQIIVLKQTVPLRGKEGFELNLKENQTVSFQNDSTKQYEIVDIVDKLPVYLSETYHTVCFIVNEETFKERNEIEIPSTFYIKVKDNKYQERVESKLVGNSLLEISIPKEEEKLLRESERVLRYIVIGIMLIIVFCTVNSIFSNFLLRYQVNHDEYRILNLIGLSRKDSIIIFLYEILTLFVVGSIISIPMVYGVTYVMQILLLKDIGNYLYQFPLTDYGIVVTFVFLFMLFITIPIIRKIKDIGILRE